MALALLYASMARPTMVCESFHGPFTRIQRRVCPSNGLPYRSKTNLVLHYSFDGGAGFVKTDDETWHRLMSYIRHEASWIGHIHLLIGKGFWDIANWQLGTRGVLKQNSLRNSPNPKDYPNFLTKVAKIAAPADRWKNHYLRENGGSDYDENEDENYSSRGTKLKITIDGTESKEQRIFVRRLEYWIRQIRRARPRFVGRDKYTRD